MRKKIRCFKLTDGIKNFEFNSFEDFEKWVDDGAEINYQFTPEKLEEVLNNIEADNNVEVIQVVTNETCSINSQLDLDKFIVITREKL